MLSSAYSAEYGRATGGVVNTVTRSGTNKLGGTAFWFLRNRTLNARDPTHVRQLHTRLDVNR